MNASENDTAVFRAEDAGEPTHVRSKKQKRTRRFGALLMLLLVGVTLYLIFRDTSLADVWASVKSVNPLFLALAAAASLFSSALLGFALYIALRALCGKRVSLWDSLACGYVGQYYSAITPSATGGQPMQLYMMCQNNVDVSFASLALLLVNISYQLVVLLVPALLFPFRAALVHNNIGNVRYLVLFGVIVSLAIVLFLLFAIFSKSFAARVCGGVISLLCRIKLIRNREKADAAVQEHILRYRSGAKAFSAHPRLLALELLIYVVQMCSQFAVPYFIYRAFGLSGYGLIDFLALQSALYLAVCFLPLPGAAGASESAFLSMFRVVFAEALIVPAMLLSRLVSFYVILILSGVVTLIFQVIVNRRRERRSATLSAQSEEASAG